VEIADFEIVAVETAAPAIVENKAAALHFVVLETVVLKIDVVETNKLPWLKLLVGKLV
jgi:hypothetical protein